MKKATLLWIDLEMTGLVPGKDKIIEVAAIATDWQLTKIAEYTGTVRVPESLMKERMVGPFWEEHHDSRDALIAENASGKPITDIEDELLAFIADNFKKQSIEGDEKGQGKIILAGNSIHQDRKFIDLEMPRLASKLHYRMLDVSAWKVYFEGALNKRYTKRELHRALDDIEGSIDELKWYLSFLRKTRNE